MRSAHPSFCTTHECHHRESGALHRNAHRPGLVHRYGDCISGRYGDDGEEFTVRVEWTVVDDETIFSQSEGWSLTADLDVIDGDTGDSVRVHVGIGDLRKISQYLNDEADALEAWRIGEIARRAEGGDGQ